MTVSSGGLILARHDENMIERWSIIFGEVLIMIGLATLFGFLALPAWQAAVLIVMGIVGVIVGFYGGEMPARNYFQVLALGAGVGLVMALGAVLSGSRTLLGVPLTTGSFILFVIVVAATFFAGFEPEAIIEEEAERELAPQV